MRALMRKWLGIESLDASHKNLLQEVEQEVEKLENSMRTLERKMCRVEELYKDLVSIGVDVHFKEPHMILIYSRLGGGQLREISANFDTIAELNAFVRTLKAKYNTSYDVWDAPQTVHEIIGRGLKTRRYPSCSGPERGVEPGDR